jgi:hypothetical protein
MMKITQEQLELLVGLMEKLFPNGEGAINENLIVSFGVDELEELWELYKHLEEEREWHLMVNEDECYEN